MRYVYKPRGAYVAFDEYGDVSSTADTIIEDDKEPVFTGLYDAIGQELYREPVTVRMGFVGKRER
jgi:hypothetical protein